MGVNLSDIVPVQVMELEDLAGHTVAIDAYNAIYQFLSIIRGPDGTPLKDGKGRVTSHLAAYSTGT
jgi:flap endonuclease-1